MTPLLASLLVPLGKLAIKGAESLFSKLSKSGDKKKALVGDVLAAATARLRESDAVTDADATVTDYGPFIEALFQQMKSAGALAEQSTEGKLYILRGSITPINGA